MKTASVRPSRTIHCSWCGGVIAPKAARMRMFESESIRVSGTWLAHFHPECGDAVLDMCEARNLPQTRNISLDT